MRLIHLSDLHIGKRVNEFSMLEDQEYILRKVIEVIDSKKPNGVIIAGDVYDKSTPSEEAIKVFEEFLKMLARRHLDVYIISGNHDSARRLSFASELIDASGIHIAPVYDGSIKPYILEDEDALVNIFMLPFVKPVTVRSVLTDKAEEIVDYTSACKAVLDNIELHTCAETTNRNREACNILVAHQFVTGATTCESEELSVGGIDNVDASIFDGFDYVALGHIHGPQHIGRETIRYSGTLLKYSFSECHHHKSITILDIKGKHVDISTVAVEPLRDMREIKGTYLELTSKDYCEKMNSEDYIHAILTDEDEVRDAMAKLRCFYPNIMKLSYDNKRTQRITEEESFTDVEHKSEIELFEEFFLAQNNKELSDEQKKYTTQLINELKNLNV